MSRRLTVAKNSYKRAGDRFGRTGFGVQDEHGNDLYHAVDEGSRSEYKIAIYNRQNIEVATILKEFTWVGIHFHLYVHGEFCARFKQVFALMRNKYVIEQSNSDSDSFYAISSRWDFGFKIERNGKVIADLQRSRNPFNAFYRVEIDPAAKDIPMEEIDYMVITVVVAWDFTKRYALLLKSL